MKRFISVSLILTSVSSCTENHRVAEADLLGAWESVKLTKPFMNGLPIRNRVMFYQLNRRLIMAEYTNWKTATINESGDMITLQDKCLKYAETLKLMSGKDAHQDTLIIGAHSKYTRMNNEIYISGKKAFLDGIRYRKPL